MEAKFNRNSKLIRKAMMLSQEQQLNNLAESNKDLNAAAPNIHPHIITTSSNALNYLYNKLPKPQQEFLGDSKWQPSKSQMHQWNEVHDIINDPHSVLDHVKKGTLNSHHIEAVKNVYPSLIHEMKQAVMENMSPENIKKLNYSKRIALSKFLGQPMDSSLTQQSILSNQAAFAMNKANNGKQGQTQGQQQMGKSTLGGMKEIKVGERDATVLQREEK
jgi:hypothetical protein